MSKPALLAKEFEPEFVAALTSIFEDRILFNRVLGLRITEIRPERVAGRIDMKSDLVGHYHYNRIHGGVISAGLDAMAGLAVMAALGARHMDEPVMQRLHRFSRVGTIDLRVDYLRPGISDHFTLHAEVMRIGSRVGTIDLRVDYLRPGISDQFTLHAEVMRIGSRVASTRMEFRGGDGTLFSTGTAAYIVS